VLPLSFEFEVSCRLRNEWKLMKLWASYTLVCVCVHQPLLHLVRRTHIYHWRDKWVPLDNLSIEWKEKKKLSIAISSHDIICRHFPDNSEREFFYNIFVGTRRMELFVNADGMCLFSCYCSILWRCAQPREHFFIASNNKFIF
jgi:hypothetical protein